MSSFDEIRKQIEKDLAAKQNPDPVAVASKPTPAVDANGMPAISQTAFVGTVVSRPGTEKVVLDTSTFQFMECSAAGYKTYDKRRYCIVEKGQFAQYGNQYINSAGERVHILTREVYQLLLGVISSASRQIRQLSAELEHAKEMRDTYKLTIDSLRKNGVID